MNDYKRAKAFDKMLQTWNDSINPDTKNRSMWHKKDTSETIFELYASNIVAWLEFIQESRVSVETFNSEMIKIYKKLQHDTYRGLFVGTLARLCIEHDIENPFITVFMNQMSLNYPKDTSKYGIKTKDLINSFWLAKAFNLDTFVKVKSSNPFYPCQHAKDMIKYKNKLNIIELFIRYNIAPNYLDDMNVKTLISKDALNTLFEQNHPMTLAKILSLCKNKNEYNEKIILFIEDKEIRQKWAANANDNDLIEHYLGFINILYNKTRTAIDIDHDGNMPSVIEMLSYIKNQTLKNTLLLNKELGMSNNAIIELLNQRHIPYLNIETPDFNFSD